MTREDSYRLRCRCFSYLASQGILSSSEEVNDWAAGVQIFCHYAYTYIYYESARRAAARSARTPVQSCLP